MTWISHDHQLSTLIDWMHLIYWCSTDVYMGWFYALVLVNSFWIWLIFVESVFIIRGYPGNVWQWFCKKYYGTSNSEDAFPDYLSSPAWGIPKKSLAIFTQTVANTDAIYFTKHSQQPSTSNQDCKSHIDPLNLKPMPVTLTLAGRVLIIFHYQRRQIKSDPSIKL